MMAIACSSRSGTSSCAIFQTRSATYSSSRRIQDLRVGEDLIPDDPVQALLRDEVNRPAEELFQVLLQSEIRHAQVIAGNAHVEQVHIAVRPRIAARNRPEDR